MVKEFEGIIFPVQPYLDLEGVVGVGKTTQAKLLFEDIKCTFPDRDIVLAHEPGGSEIADAIRQVVQVTKFGEEMQFYAEAALYAASRGQTLPTVVRPTLARGGIVVTDRSVITSIAYQGYGRGLGLKTIVDINAPIVRELWPSKVLVINPDLETALSRARDRLGDKFESMGVDFFERVAQGYMFLAEKYPDLVEIIDGNGTIGEVHARIKTAGLNFLLGQAGGVKESKPAETKPFEGRKVYFSAPIKGAVTDPELAWQVVQFMKGGGAEVLSEHVGGRTENERDDIFFIRTGIDCRTISDPWKAHREWDIRWVEQATDMVVIVDDPSHGVGAEVEHGLLKPRLGLNRTRITAFIHESKVGGLSSLIRGVDSNSSPEFRLRVYKNVEDIKRMIVEDLGVR